MSEQRELRPCPFCGGAVTWCDESPLYGGSIMHDETECLFKNNLLFHGNIAERWNSRPLEDALQARIAELESFLCLGEQLDHLLECYGESDEPMTNGAEAIRDWMQEHVIKPKKRIAELEAELEKRKARNKLLYDTAIKKLIEKNQRIAELEKSAIVWHSYPDEKPERPMGTLVNRLVDWFTMLILYKDKNGNRFVGRDTYHWWEDDEPAFESEMDESITVIGFAYLPAPPEEVSND